MRDMYIRRAVEESYTSPFLLSQAPDVRALTSNANLHLFLVLLLLLNRTPDGGVLLIFVHLLLVCADWQYRCRGAIAGC